VQDCPLAGGTAPFSEATETGAREGATQTGEEAKEQAFDGQLKRHPRSIIGVRMRCGFTREDARATIPHVPGLAREEELIPLI